MSNNSLATSNRLRIKEPVYTSDKRAKYTQRESKKWIRLCAVVGYIFFVSLPATSLSVYYIWIWDPNYIGRFPPDHNQTLKTDYTVWSLSSVRQRDQSIYNQDVLNENNSSKWISESTIKAYLLPSFIKTTERLLKDKPLKVPNKISQNRESSNTAGTQLKMERN